MKVQEVVADMQKQRKVTSQDIESVYDEFEIDINNWSDEPQYFDGENEKYIIRSEFDRYGGEGQGEEYWMVSKITFKETGEICYVKFDGYYESWNGSEMTGWDVVSPHEVSVIKWY